ncbi:MAG: hypothetical protein Q8Q94_02540 [bacterium]|nr:hypothetical protein [bacterium]MDZ4299778.1 hypothetical protein [Candidatus Sungbacteria bacterium]
MTRVRATVDYLLGTFASVGLGVFGSLFLDVGSRGSVQDAVAVFLLTTLVFLGFEYLLYLFFRKSKQFLIVRGVVFGLWIASSMLLLTFISIIMSQSYR